MGAFYLQDAVCVVPSRSDLDENMQYIAEAITEMGGIYHLFQAAAVFPEGDTRLADGFREQADATYQAIIGRLEAARMTLPETADLTTLETAEEELKRERVAYLRAKRLAYFGGDKSVDVEKQLDQLRRALDDINREE